MRYSERNPVRARLLTEAASWAWSSAAVHCGTREPPSWLDLEKWSKRCSARTWREYLGAEESEEEVATVRRCTHKISLDAADFARHVPRFRPQVPLGLG